MGKGISMSSLLGVAFIVLKLCNVIEWSWWWVLSPIWASILLSLSVIVLLAWLTGGKKCQKPYTRK